MAQVAEKRMYSTVHAKRDRKLEEGRQQRQLRRQQSPSADADRLIRFGQCKTLQLDVSISTLPDKM